MAPGFCIWRTSASFPKSDCPPAYCHSMHCSVYCLTLHCLLPYYVLPSLLPQYALLSLLPHFTLPIAILCIAQSPVYCHSTHCSVPATQYIAYCHATYYPVYCHSIHCPVYCPTQYIAYGDDLTSLGGRQKHLKFGEKKLLRIGKAAE